MIPVRTKKAARKELPMVGGMPLNLNFDKQNKIVKRPDFKVGKVPTMEEINNIRREWEEVKTSFIHNGCLYELHSSRQDKKWKGVSYYPLSAPVLIPKEKCILISKHEPILKLYYAMCNRITFLKDGNVYETDTNSSIAAVFEQTVFLKFTIKILIESFTE